PARASMSPRYEPLHRHPSRIRGSVRRRAPVLTPWPPLPFAALRASSSGEGERPTPYRVLDPGLSKVDMDADSRLRPVARLRRDRAARAPEKHGPDSRARAVARRRTD